MATRKASLPKLAHPLDGAALVLRRSLQKPRPGPHVKTLDVSASPVNEPRAVGTRVTAALDRAGTLFVSLDGVVRTFQSPGEGHFDVAPDGQRAWVGFQTSLHEADLGPGVTTWRSFSVAGPDDDWVSSVARVDDEHVLVRFGSTLRLLQREGESWQVLQSTRVPAKSTVTSCVMNGCVALATPAELKLLTVHGGKVRTLAGAPMPKLRHKVLDMVRTVETQVGELWLDPNRVEFVQVSW